MRQREDGAGGVSGWDWSGKGGAKRKPYTGRRLRGGGGGGGGGGGERAVAWGFRENLEASSSFSFRAAPRGAEERGEQGGDERVWRPLLWWGPGQRSAGRARSGFSTRGRASSLRSGGDFPPFDALPARQRLGGSEGSRRWGARVGTRGGLREARV